MTSRTTKPSPDPITKSIHARADALDDGSPNGKLKAEFVRLMDSYRTQRNVVERHRKRGNVEKEALALVELRSIENKSFALAERLKRLGIDAIALAGTIANIEGNGEPDPDVRIVPDDEEEHWSRLELWCVSHQTWHVAARGETELMMILLSIAKQAEGART